MKLFLNTRIKLKAVSVLFKELGLMKLLGLPPGLTKRQRKGEPFQDLEKAETRKDIESRALIGDAILLYRELLNIYPKDKAEDIARKVILESAVKQLSILVPKLSAKEILAMQPDRREEKFNSIVSQFPNADFKIRKVLEDEFEYIITRCRLVELIIAVGHSELSDAFCTGDGVYFERHQPDIIFTRNQKIGSGDPTCVFNFKLKR